MRVLIGYSLDNSQDIIKTVYLDMPETYSSCKDIASGFPILRSALREKKNIYPYKIFFISLLW